MRKAIRIFATQVLLFGGVAFGQSLNSTVLGRVTDPSGAPIPDAAITVTNTQTGIAVKTKTSSSGTYSVPELIAGVYSVSATKTGFQTRVVSDIQVLSSSTVRQDLRLKIGSVTQTVSVVGRAPLVQTDSSNISGSVTTTQLTDLPTSLQTIDTFMALAPGVQALPNTNNNNPPMGGSTHWGSVHFTLDGVGADQPGNGGGVNVSGVGMLVLPPPSSIRELKIQSDNMSAKYAGKANVNIVTKNGTNQFHGTAYEYLHNTILNANEFLSNAHGQPRAPEHLNQFGGNIGGPIKRNKAFFFFDYGSYHNHNTAVVQHDYPSMAMRQGDFSALCTAPANEGGGAGTFDSSGVCSNKKYQLYNPFTGAAFPNNQIPDGLIAAQAKDILKYLPAPTDSGLPGLPSSKINNFYGTIPITEDMNAYDLRIDYNISSRDSLNGDYAQRSSNPWDTSGGYNSKFGNGIANHGNYAFSVSEVHTFNANTLNSFRVGWSKYTNTASGQNADFSLKSIFPTAPGDTVYNGLPFTTVSGYGTMFKDIGTAKAVPQWTLEFTDDFTYIHGKHTIEAGIDETGYKIYTRSPAGTSIHQTGLFNFTGVWTSNAGWPTSYPSSNGDSFADLLLGLPHNDAPPVIGVFGKNVFSRRWGAYAQDTWQAQPNLTINFGLRYDYQSPWLYENQNQVTTFSPAANALELPENSPTATLPAEGANPDLFNAYHYVTTQSQGEPLQYVRPDKNNFAPRVGFAWRPFGGTRTVLRGAYGIYYNLQPAYVGSRNEAFNPPWNFGVVLPFTTDLPSRKKISTSFQPDLTFTDPYPSTNTKGVATPANPSVIYFQHNFQNAMDEEWNLTVEHQFGANWKARASYVGDHTDHIPYNATNINIPVTQTPNETIQDQRPYQPWGVINFFDSTGYQNFEQLQLGLQHRFASGFLFDANYQFTRSLDNVPPGGGLQNYHFPNLDYGNSNLIRRHFLVFNYLYQLPFGQGRHWLSGRRGLGDAVLGGWEVSGITTYASGTPFNLGFSVPNTVTGWWGGRPDVVSRNQIYSGQQSGHDIVNGVQWFNPAAFGPPAEWTWGNAARNMVFGPGYWNWDMSGMKDFRIWEKTQLTFRGDFLDAFNHFNLGNPNNTIADTRDGGNPNPKAGVITSGSGNRTVQLSLILKF